MAHDELLRIAESLGVIRGALRTELDPARWAGTDLRIRSIGALLVKSRWLFAVGQTAMLAAAACLALP